MGSAQRIIEAREHEHKLNIAKLLNMARQWGLEEREYTIQADSDMLSRRDWLASGMLDNFPQLKELLHVYHRIQASIVHKKEKRRDTNYYRSMFDMLWRSKNDMVEKSIYKWMQPKHGIWKRREKVSTSGCNRTTTSGSVV